MYPAATLAVLAAVTLTAPAPGAHTQSNQPPITGQAAFTDYSQEKPGTVRKLTISDLPAPYATKGVDAGSDKIDRPDNAWPQAPAGFKVEQYATGIDRPA